MSVDVIVDIQPEHHVMLLPQPDSAAPAQPSSTATLSTLISSGQGEQAVPLCGSAVRMFADICTWPMLLSHQSV